MDTWRVNTCSVISAYADMKEYFDEKTCTFFLTNYVLKSVHSYKLQTELSVLCCSKKKKTTTSDQSKSCTL